MPRCSAPKARIVAVGMLEESESPESVETEQEERPTVRFVLVNLMKWVGGFMLLVLLGYIFLYLAERFFR